MVTLEMLNDYLYLKKEIEELEKDIAKKEKELRKIIEDGTVIDSVSGGYGGTQHFRIEGIPTADIETRKRLLQRRCNRLEQMRRNDLEMVGQIETFIDRCQDVQVRLIVKWRFVDCLPWARVALNLGGGNTEDTAKKKLYRYLEGLQVVPNVPK